MFRTENSLPYGSWGQLNGLCNRTRPSKVKDITDVILKQIQLFALITYVYSSLMYRKADKS